MVSPRYTDFNMTAQQIADAVGARVVGEAAAKVKWVKSVASADEHALVFVDDPKFLPEALASKAVVIVAGEFAADSQTRATLLIAAQPKLAFARAAALLHADARPQPGVHPSAVVDASARVGKNVTVAPNSVISAKAVIGNHSVIGPNCFIGEGVRIGSECVLKSNVTIYPCTTLGGRVTLHAGVVLGSDGFGYVPDRTTGKYEKFPQIGTLTIGDDVEIGANSTIDRGALDGTIIEDGVKIDNLVHIAHNVRVGKNVVIAAQTGISGSAVIEQNVIVAGQVGIADHVTIEEGAILGAQCGVPSNKTIRGKGILFWGTPARPIREYLKELAVLSRLAKK
jgi:UDP-3-O-[3-hydroxymyristoyl] glucosamine N-acyltransferase